MNKIAVIFLAFVALLLCYAALDLPATGDPEAPAAQHVSPRYIEAAYKETATKNMVAAVLADYRSFDTLGEVFVIVIAGIAVVYILGIKRRADEI